MILYLYVHVYVYVSTSGGRSAGRPLSLASPPRLSHLRSKPKPYDILYYTILHYTMLYYTILYYTILQYTMLRCTILYYNILYHHIYPGSASSTCVCPFALSHTWPGQEHVVIVLGWMTRLCPDCPPPFCPFRSRAQLWLPFAAFPYRLLQENHCFPHRLPQGSQI